jgi:7-cyano-7-deazaguanine synthase
MRTLVIYSGGLDSTVLLYYLARQGHEVTALSIDYGQRHRRELDAAQRICAQAAIPWQGVDLRAVTPFLSGSSQTDLSVPVPYGHYAEDSMKATVVPNRNMLLFAVGIAAAISSKAHTVAYAAHAGDHPIYPDCRPPFIEAMQRAAHLCDWTPITLLAPFQMMTKANIVRLGAELAVPLAQTWSCYEGADTHCGRCGTCVERREAFALANIPDPTAYRSGA